VYSAFRAFRSIRPVRWPAFSLRAKRQNVRASLNSANTNFTWIVLAAMSTGASPAARSVAEDKNRRKSEVVASMELVMICRASTGSRSKPSFSLAAKEFACVQLSNSPNSGSTTGPARFSMARQTTAASPQSSAVNANRVCMGCVARSIPMRVRYHMHYTLLIKLHSRTSMNLMNPRVMGTASQGATLALSGGVSTMVTTAPSIFFSAE
jgi:hypothetical protein